MFIKPVSTSLGGITCWSDPNMTVWVTAINHVQVFTLSGTWVTLTISHLNVLIDYIFHSFRCVNCDTNLGLHLPVK